MNKNISIVGIGDGGAEFLSKNSLKKINDAHILIGGERHLVFFNELKSKKIPVKKNLAGILEVVKKEAGKKKIAVLVSGDPFFFGLGKYLTNNLSDIELNFYPYPSSIQLAFSLIKESWDDAFLTSVHAGDIRCILPALRKHKKIAILTDKSNTPSRIASLVRDNFGDIFSCCVCENLEGKKERVTRGSLKKITGMKFSPLNVMILIKKKEEVKAHPFFGLPDRKYKRRKPRTGLITKPEIRAIALSKMEVQPDSIVWDVGAGSGSVSIEAASFAENGKVFAIEKNKSDIKNINENIRKFIMPQVICVNGLAPGCFIKIQEDPDVLFVGGTSGKMEGILKTGLSRLKKGGRFVINVIALENLGRAMSILKKMKVSFEVLSVNTGKSKDILGLTRLEALNPVFIIYGKK